MNFSHMDRGVEQQKEPQWQEATDADLAEIKKRRLLSLSDHALVYKRDDSIIGFLTYRIAEPDAHIKHKRLFVDWWEIPKRMRTPNVLRSFIRDFAAFLKLGKFEFVDCHVSDDSPIQKYLITMFSKRTLGTPIKAGNGTFFEFSVREILENLKS